MKIVVVGAGGHAKVIVDSIERMGTWELVGLLDAHLPVGTQILGHNVLGSDQLLPQLFAEGMVTGVVIAVGDNFLRAKIASALRKLAPAIAFPAIIHPAASIARSAKIGVGTVVMAGAVVNSSATVGEFCILNTNCSLDHDCTLGNYASLAPNACVGGSATIGESTAISLGANVIHRVTIGAHTVVGAGATVLKDLPGHSVAYGTPARVIRARLEGEKYL